MYIMMTSTVTQVPLKNCDGGHYCSPPKECCKQGCCYLLAPSVSYRPPSLSHTNNVLHPIISGHWYFWAALTATVAGIVCACSVWRRHTQRTYCCERSGRDDRASEPDSNGSCYAPPHYSRCNSFHQGPPPYSEVTSKPDLYPLVISYNGFNVEPQQKVGRCSESYLMMQYFKNYIVRPVGTLSATSTMDSLGSSFICSATNEPSILVKVERSVKAEPATEIVSQSSERPTAKDKSGDDPKVKQQKEVDAINNRLQLLKKALEKYDKIVKNIGFMAYNQAVSSYLSGNVQPDEIVCANTQIPPPYSSAASLEGISVNGINEEASTRSNSTIPRSASIVTANAFHLVQHSPGNSSQNVDAPLNLPTNKEVSITNNPCYMQLADTFTGLPNISGMSVTTCSTSSNLSESDDSFSRTMVKTASSLNYELEVGSREYGNKFSGLLNLSVCTPSNKNLFPVAITATSTPHDLHHYSVANSATSSGVSSLANLSTPASPPQATSPTAELRELLDKIQQLPHRKSPDNLLETRGRSCFGRSKAKTLYMPLNDVTMNRPATSGKAIALFGRGARSWLSQSAPNTPSGNFMPSFPVAKKHSEIQKGSKGKVCDGRPLLNQNEESDEELPRKHCL